MDVVLRGYSGYNTRWALKVVETGEGVFGGVRRWSGAVAGDSDSVLRRQRRVPSGSDYIGQVVLEDPLKEALFPIEMRIGEERLPEAIVVLISPPPIDENARLLHPFTENVLGLPERTNQAAGAYAKACVAVAGECGIPAVDLWTKMQQFPDWQKAYLRDGLHLSEGGNRIVFEEVIKKLREAGLSLETLPVDLPLIVEIDPNEPLKTFQK
ncbi:GDSL esterase/lipase [Actinidia chinensis var. chinensis]|uniref:GDSL esterase/lipase n=1 Tax=Actinidia chinensis var. chinensis TaxID=1590841 RepID=A0A2R6RAL3_ACTCC|nr:GDSL esterase/lipase [Actinidia chinensis var. chinensis]